MDNVHTIHVLLALARGVVVNLDAGAIVPRRRCPSRHLELQDRQLRSPGRLHGRLDGHLELRQLFRRQEVVLHLDERLHRPGVITQAEPKAPGTKLRGPKKVFSGF